MPARSRWSHGENGLRERGGHRPTGGGGNEPARERGTAQILDGRRKKSVRFDSPSPSRLLCHTAKAACWLGLTAAAESSGTPR